METNKTKFFTEVLETIKELISTGPKEFYTVPEACKVLGISRTTLYHLRKTGQLESRKIGIKKVVITKRSINSFVFGNNHNKQTISNL